MELSDVKHKAVCFGNNNPGKVTNDLFNSFVQLVRHDLDHGQHLGGFITLQSGACLSIYRNKLVETFLNGSPCQWLWFVDSDIKLEPDTLERLMEHADPEKAPILGGNYFMAVGSGEVVPSMFYRKRFADGTIKMAPVWSMNNPTWPRNELVKCDGFGMGCTLIHRSVFERMIREIGFPEPWFAQDNIGGVVHGEDLTFFHRVKEMGYPAYVHTGIEVGHIKTQNLNSVSLGLGDPRG